MQSSIDWDEIWSIDFEFSARAGDLPAPVCLVAHELKSNAIKRIFHDELLLLTEAPFNCGPQSLVLAYYASAELSCFKVLKWKEPENLIDLYAEFRCITNGLTLTSGNGLIGAMKFFNLNTISVTEKEEMRALAMRGPPYTAEEKTALLDYCQSDVDALAQLYPKMIYHIDTPRALFRGEYMKVVANMESRGIPIDEELLKTFIKNWEQIRTNLIQSISQKYPVFEGTTFKYSKFEKWLIENTIPWPRLPTGKLMLDDDSFKSMAKSFPIVSPLHQAREILSKLRLNSLEVHNGRNRCLLSPFRSTTGRNQPSNSKFIFGLSAWARGLICPTEGRAIAYIDWSQQEFGIAAKLSNDENMMAAYKSGDPYMAFAIQAGAAPEGATKKTHGNIRKLYKECILAVQYSMGEQSLAEKINSSISEARALLELHKKTYKTFWKWSDSTLDFAKINKYFTTVYGWKIQIKADANPRSVRNFPMQATGAEILRAALIMLDKEGIQVCAPIHDAILIEAPIDIIEEEVKRAQEIMKKTTSVILDGFELNSDVSIYKFPQRYMDERGSEIWELVTETVSKIATPPDVETDTRIIY